MKPTDSGAGSSFALSWLDSSTKNVPLAYCMHVARLCFSDEDIFGKCAKISRQQATATVAKRAIRICLGKLEGGNPKALTPPTEKSSGRSGITAMLYRDRV